MTDPNKVKESILRIIEKVRDFEWEHDKACRYKAAPINECPTKECDPFYHIRKVLEKWREDA